MRRYQLERKKVSGEPTMLDRENGAWVRYEDAIAHGAEQFAKGRSTLDTNCVDVCEAANEKGCVEFNARMIDGEFKSFVRYAKDSSSTPDITQFTKGGSVTNVYNTQPIMGEQGSEAISPEVRARQHYDDVVKWLMGEPDYMLAKLIVDAVDCLLERGMSVDVATRSDKTPAPWDDNETKSRCTVTLTRKVSSE